MHTDLKPANIILEPDSLRPRIIDFGLSRDSLSVSQAYPGGTRGFTAPECFESEGAVGPTADIYSLGKII